MTELLVSFLISVVASIVAYYICKWLDGDKEVVISPRSTSPLKDGENPSSANYWGFRYAFGKAYVRISCFIVADIIAYDSFLRNIHFPCNNKQ